MSVAVGAACEWATSSTARAAVSFLPPASPPPWKRAAPPPVADKDSLSVVEENCAHLVTFTPKSELKLVILVICFAYRKGLADLGHFQCEN